MGIYLSSKLDIIEYPPRAHSMTLAYSIGNYFIIQQI